MKFILENWKRFLSEEDTSKVYDTAQSLGLSMNDVRKLNDIAAKLARKGVTSDDIHIDQQPDELSHVRKLLPMVGISEDELYDEEIKAIKMAFPSFEEDPDPDQDYYDVDENYMHIHDGTYEDGKPLEEDFEFWDDTLEEAEYRGRKVTLNKPTRGDVKKFKVYVKDPKTGNVKKVNFGDPNMRIKKSNPARRKSFRARHNCDNPGPKTKARYWSCKKW
jgi:hypothetical protein